MKLEDEIRQNGFSSQYQRMMLNVLFTASWLENQNARIFKTYRLTLPQYNVLRILRGQHGAPASIGLIQERMLDRSSNASRLVDKLLEKRLVERKPCPADRRQMDVRITRKGLDLLKELDGPVRLLERSFKTLTEKEARLLSDLLDKLRG